MDQALFGYVPVVHKVGDNWVTNYQPPPPFLVRA